MRPPITYFGGKAGMADRIVALMPPHRVYLEPFFGSGAVLFAKPPSTHEIVNDLDGALVTFFRVLRDRPDDLDRACRLTPYARAEYVAADLDEPDLAELEVARRFWVRVNQSFAKTAGTHTGWSVTTARTAGAPRSTVARRARFEECAARLAEVSIEQYDAADLVGRLATEDTVIYADPPYVATSRVHRADRGARTMDYRCDMGGDEDHRRLAAALHETPATVLLSGYPNDLYDDLYGDWWHVDRQVTVHSSNAARVGRSGRVERVWSNRELDLPATLFDLEEVGA